MASALGRLKSQADFSRVFRSGGRLKISPLVFWHLPGEANQVRLGIVISKKTAPLATRRNYLRRVLRHLFQLTTKSWGERLVGDTVVMVVENAEHPAASFDNSIQQWLKKF